MNRLAVARVAAYAAVVVSGAWGLWSVQRTSDEVVAEGLERREAACEQADELRAIIREVSRDGDLEVGEAIIDVADADPALVAEFRDVLGRRLTANVNQLPGRRWDEKSQECVDIEVPTTEPGG